MPFCRKHNIEPRNPDSYFNQKTDPTKGKKRPDFVKDRRWIKREYDEFKVRINGLPDVIKKRCDSYNKAETAKEKNLVREKNNGIIPPDYKIEVPQATWMADGTHWPGTWFSTAPDHAKGDHAGILQVLLHFRVDGQLMHKLFIHLAILLPPLKRFNNVTTF